MTETQRTYPQHRWGRVEGVKTCEQCGLVMTERPIPGRLKWHRDWTRGDRTWSTEHGDRTPRCEVAA